MWIPKGMALIRERHLFEAQRLLEEMRFIIFVQFDVPSLQISNCNNFFAPSSILNVLDYAIPKNPSKLMFLE